MKTNLKYLCLAILVFCLSIPTMAQVERREVGSLVLEDIPAIPLEVVERMLQYTNARSAVFTGWQPEGKGLYVATRFGETSQVHYVEQPGGTRRQITFFNEPVSNTGIRPAGQPAGFLFLKDVGGSEFYQLFYFDLGTSQYRMLTDGQSRNGSAIWSHKGDRIAYYSTARNGRDWDIVVTDMADPGATHTVLEAEGTYFPHEWSPDDSRLLVVKYVSINESYVFVVDMSSGEVTRLNPVEEKIAYGDAAWSRDGRGIYYTSDENSEFQRLRYYDLASGTSTVLTGDIDWDVEAVELSRKGDIIAFITNEDGIDRLHLRKLKGWKTLQVPELPVGLMSGLKFSPDDRQLALTLNTPQTPSDTYTLDIKKRQLTRWTYSEVGGLATGNFAVPELVHYPTFDEVDDQPRMIPAFYYKPAGIKPPYPVIISIHGGPESQAVPYFSSTYQYWINELGVAMLIPNVRGSSGYGKTYVQLDNGFNREGSVKDIGALLDWIENQPELDRNRIAVYGGSYGGYMVLACLTHYNDRLRTGVEIVGISNFVTFLENTQEYRRDLRRAEYGDERDPDMREFLISISPTTNAQKITKPMFIAQGLNDPRVPASESEQIVATIRENEGQVWYMLAKDEGHGFKKKFNSDFYRHAVVLFWEEFLLK